MNRCCSGVKGICVIRASACPAISRDNRSSRGDCFTQCCLEIVEQQEGLPCLSLGRIVGRGLDLGQAVGQLLRVQRGRDEIRRLGLFQPNDLPPDVDAAGQRVAQSHAICGRMPCREVLRLKGDVCWLNSSSRSRIGRRLVGAGGDRGLQCRKLPQDRRRPFACRSAGQFVQTCDQRFRLVPRVVDFLLDLRLGLCSRLRRLGIGAGSAADFGCGVGAGFAFGSVAGGGSESRRRVCSPAFRVNGEAIRAAM